MNSVQNSPMIDVLDVIEACKPTIYRLACSYEVDAEDLIQDLAVEMLEDPRDLKNPAGYYTVKVRYMAMNRASRDLRLDAPAYENPNQTLAEILPAGPIGLEEDHSTADRHATIVYTALQKLPLDEQEYFCTVYDITAYTPRDAGVRVRRHGNNDSRQKRAIQKAGYRHIRKDQELLQAVQESYSASAR